MCNGNTNTKSPHHTILQSFIDILLYMAYILLHKIILLFVPIHSFNHFTQNSNLPHYS